MIGKQKFSEIISSKPVLETKRLILREIEFGDQNDIFEYASDPETTKYLCWDYHTSTDVTGEFIERHLREQFEQFSTIGFGIVHKEHQKLIGMCTLLDFNFDHDYCELGYVLSRSYRKQHIMTEAAAAVLKFGFTKLKLHRIEARTWIQNIPSQIVLKNLGMRCEGILRERSLVKGAFTDFKMYSILSREFEVS